MDLVESYHALTGGIVAASGVSDKMVHLNLGLAIYFGAQLLLRDRRGSVLAVKMLVAAEFANEVMDRLFWGSWRWEDTIGDAVATLFWPITIVLISRYRRRRWEKRAALADMLLRDMRPASPAIAMAR